MIIAECLNHNKTSQGIGTTSFLNALVHGSFDITCVYLQQVQHEFDDTGHIHGSIRLIKIHNSWFDYSLRPLRKLRYLYAKVFGRSLLRDRRSLKFYREIKRLLKSESFDLVFVRTEANSIASHQAVLWLSKKLDFRWVANFNDPVPRSMMPHPYFKKGTPLSLQDRKDEILVKKILLQCHGLTSPSLILSQWFLEYYKVQEKLAPHIFKFPHVFVEKPLTMDTDILDEDNMNFVHAGSLLNERDPSFLLKAFENFLSSHPDAQEHVRITFFGSIHNEHKHTIEAFGFTESLMIVNKRISHAEALRTIADSDVMILLEAISDESPFMPGKLAEFIGLRKCIWSLSPGKSETRRILGCDYPYQCEANQVDQMESIITRLYGKWVNNEPLELTDPKLIEYVSPSQVVEEMQRAADVLQPREKS